MSATPMPTDRPAWIVTGPTSGIGRRTALALAPHGTVVLVGRDAARLGAVRDEISALPGGAATTVVADFADLASVRHAAAEITGLDLPVAGLLNNAGTFPMTPGTTPQGWDATYVTNHLGPFAFTEAVVPHLPDGARVVFVCSAVEDPDRKPAVAAGFRGARFVSVEASIRGEWLPGGAKNPAYDAYATSKQGNLAAVLALARETPRLRFNAVEPGFIPGSNLGREAPAALRLLSRYVLSPLAPMVRYWSTPRRAARVLTGVLTSDAADSGTYYDENGRAMRGSHQVSDPAFSDRVVAETRAFLRAARDD